MTDVGGMLIVDDGAGDPWSRLVSDVFRAVRSMDAAARASMGSRLEDAALAAAREALAAHPAEAALTRWGA